MAEISKEIIFDLDQQNIINTKSADPSFSHLNWADDDLKDLRSAIRDFYRVEQKGLCAFCRKDISIQSASNCQVEHIAPKSKYLEFIFLPKNLCVICADCNEIKRSQEIMSSTPDTIKNPGSRKSYPRTTQGFKIVQPHFDTYDDHILVLIGYFYVNKTQKGHFTIGACDLNRKLAALGWENVITDEASLFDAMGKFLTEPDAIKRGVKLRQIREMIVLT